MLRVLLCVCGTLVAIGKAVVGTVSTVFYEEGTGRTSEGAYMV
jgi:hypothetical protein